MINVLGKWAGRREGGGHLLNKFTDDGVARTLTSQEGDVVGLRRRDGYF